MARINMPQAKSYLQSRGISHKTATAYHIGFDPKADPAQSSHPCPRIIIPITPQYYIGRRTDGRREFAKLNSKGSTPTLFNIGSLYMQNILKIFVTEGIFDALSVIEVGGMALALNSTSNINQLLQALEKRRTDATLILCLDRDEAGQKAEALLRQGLQRLNIRHIVADICGGFRDPNEALVADRQVFEVAIAQAEHQAETRPDNTSYYIDSLMAFEIERFRNERKTGFAKLDTLSGGLYSGLYALAAISSLGKTSFALQLADQLAEGGNDVVFFSLEQSRLELVSKSLEIVNIG